MHMEITVYLSGEIHTEWRNEIINKSNELNLPIEFLSPNTCLLYTSPSPRDRG